MKKTLSFLVATLFVVTTAALASCVGTNNVDSTGDSSMNSSSIIDDSSTSDSSTSDEDSVTEKYTVTFNSNGGNDVESATVVEGEQVAKPTDPEKIGYSFDGWYVDGTDKAFDFTAKITDNITLTAKWTANDDTFYNIEVYLEDINGEFSKLSQADIGNDMQLVRFGTTDSEVDIMEEASQAVTTMSGFKLDTAQSVLTGTIKADGTAVFKVYIAREIYTLSFDGITADPISVKYGTTVDFASLPEIPEQQGKTSFWKLDGDTVSADFVWAYAENKVLTAVYIGDPRLVTFIADGSTYASETVENGATVCAPSTAPEKIGYTFEGWYANEADTAFDFTTAITADMELTARFTANTYTLSFNTDGGNDVDSIIVTYDSAISNLPTTSKVGHTFLEWNLNGTPITNETVWQFTENQIAVASWSVDFYNVTFEVEGFEIQDKTVEYNQMVVAPTFAGYDITWDFDFNNPITADTSIVGTASVKQIALKGASAMVVGGQSYEIEYNDDGSFGLLTPQNTADSYAIKASFKFDLTTEDILAFQEMGYTYLSFQLYNTASAASDSNKYVKILNDTRTVDITYGAWTQIDITLDELKTYIESGTTNFIFNGWILYKGSMYVKDMTLASYCSVTYDYAGTQTTVSVKSGEVATGAPNVPGFNFIWKLNGEEFDFNTPITSDITLTATEDDYVLKEVTLTSDSQTWIGDQWRPVEFNSMAFGQITAVNASVLYYNLDTKWKFDLTVADVEAWIEAGYTALEYTLVYSGGGGVAVKLYDGTEIPAGTHNRTMSLTVLKDYIANGTEKFATCGWFTGKVAFYLSDMKLIASESDGELKQIKVLEGSTILVNDTAKAVEYGEDGSFGLLTSTATSPWYNIVTKFSFNVTKDDIAAYKEAGYTHLTFNVKATASDTASSTKQLKLLNNTKTVDISFGQWQEISITLDEFSAYLESGSTNFITVPYVLYKGSLAIKDLNVVTISE